MVVGRVFIAWSAAFAASAECAASAQTYPTRPIKMIVGFSPGGPADVMARLVGQQISSRLGRGIVIENRPGARRHDRRARVRGGGCRRLHLAVRQHQHAKVLGLTVPPTFSRSPTR
jgi:hypothetical protein